MLARQPPGSPGAEAEPMKEEKGATATLGLGDDQVIPLDSFNWDLRNNEVAVTFVTNPAIGELSNAANSGKSFPTAFVSTYTLMARMTEVVITSFSYGRDGQGGEEATMRLNFKTVKHEPTK
jgi:hypothetical protein